MPINPETRTVYAEDKKPEGLKRSSIPLLAYQPHFLHDYLQGGCTLDASKIPAHTDGKNWAFIGDVFRRNDTTGLWDLCDAADDGSGPQYVMLEHDIDCSNGIHQSFNGLLGSQHVNEAALERKIPAALVGYSKAFNYKTRTNINTVG